MSASGAHNGVSAAAAALLIDRDGELDALAEVLAAASAGRGSAILVEGAAGIGKTSLLAATRALAGARAMTVLHARGTDLERDFAFGVVRQLLEPLVRRESDAAGLLRGAAALAAPVLRDVAAPTTGSPAGLLHGLYWLVANAAESTPMVLTIDDGHWADEPSLRFLTYLARRVEAMPVAVVIAARPVGRSDEPSATLLSELAADPDTRRIEPLALSPAGIERLLAESSGGPVDGDFAAACQAATGGNPFLLEQLARTLQAAGVPFSSAGVGQVRAVTPPAIARKATVTLARLGREPAALARAAALLGDGSPLELVGELAGLARESLASAAAALVDAGILDDTVAVQFRHPIMSGAVRAGSSQHELAAGHRRAAALLRRRGASPERLALQLLHATRRGDPQVVADLRAAAAQASRRGAPETAATMLERALEEPPEPDARAAILLELGQAELATGDPERAAAHFEEAHRCAPDVHTRARTLPLLMQARPGDPASREDVDRLIVVALAQSGDLEPELALRLRALHVLGGAPFDGPLPAGATLAEAVLLGHLVFARMTPDAVADEIADIALRGARRVDEVAEEGTSAIAFSGIVLALRWSDHLEEARRLLDRALEIARRRGSTIDFAMTLTHRASVHRRAGRLRDAEADARGALAATLSSEWSFYRGVAPLAGTLLGQDRVDEAAAALQLVGLDGEIPDTPPMLAVLLARMGIRAAQRDFGAALADWERAVGRVERTHGVNAGWIEDLAVVVDVHLGRGDQDAARAAAEHMLRLARRWGTPGAIGQALAARARTDPSSAIELLREAASTLAESPARLELARTLVALGAALRRAGLRTDSRIPLREGYELARACDAGGLVETARLELRASGLRVRSEPATGVAALTPSEGRIAELAAMGLANAEIAQELFLTVKTVEMHLTNAYRKLDIRGRRELAPALRP